VKITRAKSEQNTGSLKYQESRLWTTDGKTKEYWSGIGTYKK